MNKQIILVTVIAGAALNGLASPVYAQWDLNGMPVNINNSAGQGQVTGNQLGGGSPIQPYTESRGIQPSQNQYQTNYNQYGSILNNNPNARTQNASTPYVNPYQGGGGTLPKSSMLPLSLQQTTLPKNLSGVRFNTSTGALPPTTLDSFVLNAGGAASRIYGDEGTGFFGPPPDNGFPESSTINAGISHSADNKTLTTGHRSKLPSPSGNGATYSGAH